MALFQHLASSRLADTLAGTGLTPGQRDDIAHNLGSSHPFVSAGVSRRRPRRSATPRDAFVPALSGGMWLRTGVALLGAVAAFVFVGRKPRSGEIAAGAANGHRAAATSMLSRAFHLPDGSSPGTRPAPGAAPRPLPSPPAGCG